MATKPVRYADSEKYALLQAMQAAAQQASLAFQTAGHNKRPEKIAEVRDHFSDRLKQIGSPEELLTSGALGEAAAQLTTTEKRAIQALLAVDNFERTVPIGRAVPNATYSSAVLSALGQADGRVSAGAALSGASVQQQVNEQYDASRNAEVPATSAPASSPIVEAERIQDGLSITARRLERNFARLQAPDGVLARRAKGEQISAEEQAGLDRLVAESKALVASNTGDFAPREREAMSQALDMMGAAGGVPPMSLTPNIGKDHAGPDVNEPPTQRTGLGHVDDMLNKLPDGVREAGRAFYKSKEDYNKYMEATHQEIESLLNSGLPIEQVLALIMILLAQRAEKKLGLKIKEVGFSEQLSLASGRGGDRALMINRLQSMGLSEDQAQKLRTGDIDDKLATLLKTEYGVNDRELGILRDRHYDKEFGEATQFFDQEIGSSTDIKAQQLSIASQEYQQMMSSMASIIKTMQEITSIPISKM